MAPSWDEALVIVSLEGHPLVLPRAHVADLTDLGDEAAAALTRAAFRAARAPRVATGCDGLDLV